MTDDQGYSLDGSSRGDTALAGRSVGVRTFTWLLDGFTSSVDGVIGAISVSSDGLLIAVSKLPDRGNADRLAAVVSGMTSLAGGASNCYALGTLNRVVVDMSDGYLLLTAISHGCVLGVIADRSANLASVAYEMTLFATRAASGLTPDLIAELRESLR
jgi:uncharacterized protein